jgi:hypothetical protein
MQSACATSLGRHAPAGVDTREGNPPLVAAVVILEAYG